ncbi:RDD family protein [Nocardiopsis coralliicola]
MTAAEYAQRARSRLDLKRPEEALQIITAGLAESPGSAQLWELAASARLDCGDPDGAVDAARSAITHGSTGGEGHFTLALALLRGERHGEALEPAAAAARLLADRGRPHVLLALSLAHGAGRRYPGWEQIAADARGAAARAVELAPDDSWVQGQAGLVFRLLGDRESAKRHLGEALRINPEYGWALRQLSWMEAERRRTVPALRHLRSALQLDPSNVEALSDAYRVCRRFTGRLIWLSVVFGLISLLFIPIARDNPESAFAARTVFSGLFTAGLGAYLVSIVRMPAAVRRFMVERPGGRIWGAAVLLAPASVLGLAWTPVAFFGAPTLALIAAVTAYTVLTRRLDRAAKAEFERRRKGGGAGKEHGQDGGGRAAGPDGAVPFLPSGPPVPAPLVLRWLALLVDMAAGGVIVVAVYFAGMALGAFVMLGLVGEDAFFGPVLAVVLAAAVAALFAYHWWYTAHRAGTPGKWLAGLRVVDAETGGLPSRGRAAARAGAHLLLGLVPLLGRLADFAVMALDRPHYRGLKDDLAKTCVVLAHPRPVPVYPAYPHRVQWHGPPAPPGPGANPVPPSAPAADPTGSPEPAPEQSARPVVPLPPPAPAGMEQPQR